MCMDTQGENSEKIPSIIYPILLIFGMKVSITLSGAVYDSAHLPHG